MEIFFLQEVKMEGILFVVARVHRTEWSMAMILPMGYNVSDVSNFTAYRHSPHDERCRQRSGM